MLSAEIDCPEGWTSLSAAGFNLHRPTVRCVTINTGAVARGQVEPKEFCGDSFTQVTHEITIQSKGESRTSVVVTHVIPR